MLHGIFLVRFGHRTPPSRSKITFGSAIELGKQARFRPGWSFGEAQHPDSLRQQFFNRVQFDTALFSGSGVRILEFSQGIKDDLGDKEPCILLIVGRDGVPRRVMGACGMKAFLVGFHVVLPVFPLVNVGGAELPVLFRLIDALKESLSLLFV
jgi:hypothetical protein